MNLSKRLRLIILSLALTSVMGMALVSVTLGYPAARSSSAPPDGVDLPYREITGDIESPAISFIDSPSATCERPSPGTGACYINWNYLNVSATSGSYIISMTVTIDNQIRAYHAGFFQTSFYIPAGMVAPGYKVTCGMPASSSAPEWGNSYSYAIRARETSGLSSASYGTVACPADTVRVYLPFIQR